MQLIIPSAKVVTEELQHIGRLPSVIYPVNNNIVFDYIYEQYGNVVDSIDIICNEESDKVHSRLGNTRDKGVNILDIPILGDLGETVSFGISDGDDSVIINFGDTIVFDDISAYGDDCFFYSEDNKSSIWTFYDINEGVITKLYDKEPTKTEEIGKLFVGVFMISDRALFKKCLLDADKDGESINSFYIALSNYSKVHPLREVYTDKWLDIGHADKYYNSNLEVKAREFNHISIDGNRGILRKTSDNVDKFLGEIKWYLKLPTDVEYVTPRIFDYSLSYENPYVSMEYYAYHTVHELFLDGNLTKNQWVNVLSRIEFVCRDFRRYTLKDSKIEESLDDMYLRKTISRLEELRQMSSFEKFFSSDIKVNDSVYICLDEIIDILKKEIPKLLNDVDEFSIIHGDLCFSNIMVDSNFRFVKLIDPRGKFGEYDIYGDPRYDLAKLFHSVDGRYDYIIKDLFSVSYDSEKCCIDYEILERQNDYDLYAILLDVFKDEIGDDLERIELIESLLFLSMIPLHKENVRHQMVMLAIGLDILDRNINIKRE